MKLGIISNNKIYESALLQALSALYKDVRTYSEIDMLEEDVTLCIVVFVDNNIVISDKQAQRTDFIVIILNEQPNKSDIGEKVRSCFGAPVRLGRIVDHVVAYDKQKAKKSALTPIKLGSYILSPQYNELTSLDDKHIIKLTEKECNILIYLYQNKGQPVTRQALLDHVWGYAENVETHTLETHIYRLRQKIEQDASRPKFLMTNDNGYYLDF